MEVILHAGAHRTATTVLQKMMGQSGATLGAAGISYWGPKRTRSGLFNGLIGASDAVLPWQKGRAPKRIALRVTGEVQAGARVLFVSEENMLGTMRTSVDEQSLYPGAGARLARFAEGFRAAPVTVALAIRGYDLWWASALAFRLTRGGPLPTPSLCDRLITQPRRWRHVIADLAQALPDMRIAVWTHEALGSRPDTVVRRLTGRDVALRGARERRNDGPSAEDLRDYLRDCGADPALIRARAGRFMPFDQHQRAILRAQYAEDLAWLRTGAGGLAHFIDEPGAHRVETGQGRGRPHDGEHRRLA